MAKKISSDSRTAGSDVFQEDMGQTASSETREAIMMEANAPDAISETPVQAAIGGLRKGASDACDAVSGVVPTVSQTLSKVIYTGFYYLSYGVVYSGLVVASLIPADSVIGRGIRAGAKAAKGSFDARQKVQTEDPVSAFETADDGVGLASA